MARGTWGDRDASRWIDEGTGFLVGPAAEAYLAATCEQPSHGVVSVLALGVDRLEALAAVRGNNARRDVIARVAHSLSQVSAPIGVVPAV